MALKAIIGFDHYPQFPYDWINYADRVPLYSGTSMIQNGWLINGGQAAQRIAYPLSAYIQTPVADVWVGVRIRATSAGSSNKNLVILNLGTAITTNSNILLSTSLWMDYIGVASLKVDDSCYFEFSINIKTGVLKRRINGVDMPDMTATTNRRDWLLVLDTFTSNPYPYIAFRDIYINNDEAGISGFLGSQIVKLLPFEPVTGTDFTTSPTGGTLSGAINGAGEVPTANVAVSGASKAPLVASLTPVLPAGVVATAVEFTVSLASTIANVSVCSTKLKTGADETAGSNVTGRANNAYTYSNSAGIFEKAPGGQAWNNAVIDATDFILTPDV